MRVVDLTDQLFGRLRVVNRADEVIDTKGKWWNCICVCGRWIKVRSNSLRCGVTRSCGCLNPARLRPYEALYRRMVRDNTRFRSMEVRLTYEEFLEFTTIDQCFYCHTLIHWKEYCSGGHGYNLDRKDNDNVYTKDNLVVCCKRCNLGKRDTFTFEEWHGMTAYFRKEIGEPWKNIRQKFSSNLLCSLLG